MWERRKRGKEERWKRRKFISLIDPAELSNMSDIFETESCTIYTILSFLMLILFFALSFVVVIVFFFLVQFKSTSSISVKTTLIINLGDLFY